ncbi:uncharacterized protein LOC127462632 [Manacus candei]|uniref:uncharacterized protein LOC127462632 n=1 Tax=Manacus candei TaxID=415023 RepID=UPI002227B70F|nr:uncharacterized protein LOC127462632 [Manacus candei]
MPTAGAELFLAFSSNSFKGFEQAQNSGSSLRPDLLDDWSQVNGNTFRQQWIKGRDEDIPQILTGVGMHLLRNEGDLGFCKAWGQENSTAWAEPAVPRAGMGALGLEWEWRSLSRAGMGTLGAEEPLQGWNGSGGASPGLEWEFWEQRSLSRAGMGTLGPLQGWNGNTGNGGASPGLEWEPWEWRSLSRAAPATVLGMQSGRTGLSLTFHKPPDVLERRARTHFIQTGIWMELSDVQVELWRQTSGAGSVGMLKNPETTYQHERHPEPLPISKKTSHCSYFLKFLLFLEHILHHQVPPPPLPCEPLSRLH